MSQENQNTDFTQMDARTKVEDSLLKLSFLSDAIKFWDIDTVGIDSDTQYGFALIMEATIKDIESSVEKLDC